MKIYELNEKYIDYLHSIDNKVRNSKGKDYQFSRKYVGVILKINNFKYFAPLSSGKSEKDYFPNGEIRPSVVPLIRIVKENKDKTKSLLGKIQLSNMIPIVDENLTKIYDINNEKDIKYKIMVYNEIKFINKNKDLIIKNAKKLYQHKSQNLDIGYVKNTVDFKLLEEKALEYSQVLEVKNNNNK